MSDIHALSGAYAVDALDGEERAQFEEHLAECAECRSEVDSLRQAAALLAETTATTPPTGLRDRVLSGITTVRPLPPEQAAAPVVSLESRRRRRTTAWLVAAAAVVAIGGGAVVWQQVDDGPPSRVEQLQAAGDVQRFSLPVGDGGSATVYRSKRLNEAAIVTKGMPAAPEGKEYVLWLQHGTMMTQAGVMPVGSDNKVLFSGDAATADGAAVSIEDAGTEPIQPSDDVVALFSFNA
jgi:anti-sigma-K factor RskA